MGISTEELKKLGIKNPSEGIQDVPRKLSTEDLLKVGINKRDNSPSLTESAALGGIQGVSSDWADEAYGLASLPTRPGETYTQGRDAARERFLQAKKEYPIPYNAANMAGSIISPVNKLPGGIIAQSALTGLGASEAEDVSGMLKDTATGGLVGGLLKGVGEVGKRTIVPAMDRLAQSRAKATLNLSPSEQLKMKPAKQDTMASELRDYINIIGGVKKGKLTKDIANIGEELGDRYSEISNVPFSSTDVFNDILAKRNEAEKLAKGDLVRGYDSVLEDLSKSQLADGGNIGQARDIQKGLAEKYGKGLTAADSASAKARQYSERMLKDEMLGQAGKVNPEAVSAIKSLDEQIAPKYDLAKKIPRIENKYRIEAELKTIGTVLKRLKDPLLARYANTFYENFTNPKYTDKIRSASKAGIIELLKELKTIEEGENNE